MAKDALELLNSYLYFLSAGIVDNPPASGDLSSRNSDRHGCGFENQVDEMKRL